MAYREHKERAWWVTSDTPTWGFQAPTETENSSPVSAYLWEKIRDTLYLRKHWHILNTNTFTLAHSLWKPKVQVPTEWKVFQRGLLLGSPRNGRLPIVQGNPASGRWQGGNRLTLHPHTASNIAQTCRAGHKTCHPPLQMAIPPKPAKLPS